MSPVGFGKITKKIIVDKQRVMDDGLTDKETHRRSWADTQKAKQND
jgi:hypothetical protein